MGNFDDARVFERALFVLRVVVDNNNTLKRTMMRRFTTLGLLCLFVLGTTHFFGFEEEGFFGVTAANARFVARKEEEASLDGGETVTEVPTLTTSSSVYGKKKKKKNDGMKKKKEEDDDDESVEVPTLSSAYGKKKKKNNNNNGMKKKKEEKTKDEKSACEECVSFLRDVSDQVRSKHFRERAYKVVDEMCERVFDTDREKTTECEAMGKTYAKKAIEYAKTLSEKDKGKAACEKMHLCKKKKRRRFWSSTIETVEDAARRAARRARERVASGTFFASWFSSSSSSSPRKKTRETEKEETQRSLSSPPSSMCAFCEYGASKLAMAMNDPDFAESAKREFIAACVASETFSDEQCKNAADEYEAKFYDALQTWLDDGEACEDLLGC